MKKEKQSTLFGDLDEYSWWKKEWKGMPEFVQEDLMPIKSIKVHFENDKDIKKFADLINQKITSTTQYVWYPESEKIPVSHLRYDDKEEEC